MEDDKLRAAFIHDGEHQEKHIKIEYLNGSREEAIGYWDVTEHGLLQSMQLSRGGGPEQMFIPWAAIKKLTLGNTQGMNPRGRVKVRRRNFIYRKLRPVRFECIALDGTTFWA